ncbi:hypothetical protein BAJUN_03090 [Bajunvirus bajun]|uniref:A1 protein n=1 Tax=Brevundimonas phage vB_BgoS-Bajun TaxID=2948594 RepID=A0A9E7SU94_9CAUD|nr:hypothetical protein BAJUN_03090 [Brevundimonas phage vB_BgoS-Bajun]
MTDTTAKPAPEPFDLYAVEPEELLRLVKRAGGQRAFSRKHGVKRTTLQNRLYAMRKDPFTHRPAPQAREVMVEGEGRRRFILSSAQDGSRIHDTFLANLEAYRDYLAEDCPCEIMIAGFTYSKRLFEEHSKTSSKIIYDDRIVPYLTNERIRIADRLDFCGEMNTLPTAENPLSGFHTYTRQRWGVFPHAKVQLVSVPTMKHTPAKQIMTTGCVTKPNYVPKKAGIKAAFHHVYGAVLVEVDEDGTFFTRHLLGDDDDGSFYDLDAYVKDGKVTRGHALTALTPGDVHVAQVDPEICAMTFGISPTKDKSKNGERKWEHALTTSIVEALAPENLFIHDVSDFRARNHHEIKDPHTRFRHHVNGVESVFNELKEVAMFLTQVARRRPHMNVVVVESNHDQALLKWLKTSDYREDPVNAEFFLAAQKRIYRAIRRGEDFSVFEWALTEQFPDWKCEGVRFLQEDESLVIGNVEHANHGHRGPNGARGSVVGMTKIGPKVTMGHVHSCAIQDGVYASGTTSLMDLGYNSGPSSWSHTHVGQYPNGQRVLITISNGRWRLDQRFPA